MSAEPRDLMARYCDGDSTAFVGLYEQVAPRLLGYLMRLVRDRAAAEDLVQLTFLKLHGARARYVRGADPITWIFAIGHRTALDELRRRKRARVQVTPSGDVPDAHANLTGDALDAVDEPRADLSQSTAALAALATLPEAQRQAVTLTKLEGRSVADAAAIAGISTTAMKVRAHRGYVALRRVLDAADPPEEGRRP